MKKNCANCGKELKKKQKIYCCVSCSVSHTNKTRKRPLQNRLIEKHCKKCGSKIERKNHTERHLLCKKCKEVLDIGNKNFGELNKGNANSFGYPQIRSHSRRTYLNSTKPKKCAVCKYSKHFDICHIKAINSFPSNAKISEINHISNLIALCKNHHWEFDHGILALSN